MARALCRFLVGLGCLFGLATSLGAETVAQEYLGLEVTGNLEQASNKTLARDGVVLIVHGALAHHRLELIATLQTNLKERGINSLAITLSLGLPKRVGMFDCALEHDHRHADASDEIVAWVEWLQRKGAGRIIVLGHSRGGSQAALALVERADSGVAGLVLAAPLYQSSAEIAEKFNDQFGQQLAPLLSKARKLVEDGDGDALVEVPGFLYCRPAKVTAAAFLDYYAPDPQYDVLQLLPQIGAPVLVVLAGDDRVVPNLAAAITAARAAGRLPGRLSVKTVAGSDHFFRDLFGDELVDHVAEFLAKL